MQEKRETVKSGKMKGEIMKKAVIIGWIFAWAIIFSFAAEASQVLNSKTRETNKVLNYKAAEEKAVQEKEEVEAMAETLMQYVNELEESLKQEENSSVEQIGSLTLTEGLGKKKNRLFTGTRKLLGTGSKEDKINIVLFALEKTEDKAAPVILSNTQYEIGASKLFSAEIELNRVGVNYLLIRTTGEGEKSEHQLYQIIVEDIKTKDKLESMTLQFMK